MDFSEIEKLMNAMTKSGMRKVVIKKEGFEIELEKEIVLEHPTIPELVRPISEKRMPHAALPEKMEGSKESKEEGRFILSPMVGSFYAAPSPKDPPFVKVGNEVNPETVVCIIEAMKVMNEVKARASGKIVEILLKNGDPVEFGTPLFRIV